jgi:protein NirF
MELLSYFDLHLIYLTIFSLALAFGAGTALLGSILTLSALRDGRLTKEEAGVIRLSHAVSVLSFIGYGFSGIGLFTISYEKMMALDIFWASQTIVGLLFLSTILTQLITLPFLGNKHHNAEHGHDARVFTLMVLTAAINVISWTFLTIHHALYQFPIGYASYLAIYVAAVMAVCALFTILSRATLSGPTITLLKRSMFILSFFCILLILAASTGTSKNTLPKTEISADDEQARTAVANTLPVFTPEDVGRHNNVEDCWVIIDHEVFNASDAVTLYPDIYTCGADVTTHYRTVVAEGISERMRKKQEGVIGYTRDDVARHNTKKDCWLIIDTFVFDATRESVLHPAAFNCGTDATENYHKNHGKTISDKMMQYKIGVVNESGTAAAPRDNGIVDDTLTPKAELYVETGSWDNHNLMVIVEKDAEKILFVDGSTHKPIGRIHDIGFQPHTSVYSNDAQYMYIIARNGWLTKIDLNTLEPVKTIKVGINSRGTALTENGKYLAIGNYEPGNVVMVDPESMTILATIPTTGTLSGADVESRVGALVERGNHIIAALKDLNSVWVIDTDKKDFPVVHRFENIGDNKTPLHDAFLTPDGKFYIVAAMGSDTVWVLNTNTWEKVTEVKTGKTPHTGPGAYWGKNIYVPALGEGLITVISTESWTPVASIPTAGPGLFVRSYPDESYPYVWAETAFGEHHDEIYVIDGRTNAIVKTLIPVPGESSWHPEFTRDGKAVYVVSQTGNEVTVYDAQSFEVVTRLEANTPSAVSNIGLRIEEVGL